MAKAGESGSSWRSGKVVGLPVLVCGLLSACGGGTPSAPAMPTPTPTASGGFLHVLQGGAVVTYAIDGAKGLLRQTAGQTVGDAHTLTGEPLGRYLFAAFGPRSGMPYNPSIVAYTPDPRTGTLTPVSEAGSDPIWCPSCASWGRSQYWYWLSASATRVYGIWKTVTYHDVYPTLVTHAVDDGGRLGPAHQEDFSEWDPDGVAIDSGGEDGETLYKGTWTGGLTAHLVESDGGLMQVGGSNRCVASKVSTAQPLAAVRGFVFAWSIVEPYERTVCSWEGPRLAPRANLGLEADYAVAFTPRGVSGAVSSSAASRPGTLVAMRTSHPLGGGEPLGKKYEVRLFAMSDDGGLEPLDTVEPGYARQLLFHPSGGFLYVSHAPSASSTAVSLTVYSIDAQGHLAVVETLEGAAGAMAVTTPPQVRASTGPTTD